MRAHAPARQKRVEKGARERVGKRVENVLPERVRRRYTGASTGAAQSLSVIKREEKREGKKKRRKKSAPTAATLSHAAATVVTRQVGREGLEGEQLRPHVDERRLPQARTAVGGETGAGGQGGLNVVRARKSEGKPRAPRDALKALQSKAPGCTCLRRRRCRAWASRAASSGSCLRAELCQEAEPERLIRRRQDLQIHGWQVSDPRLVQTVLDVLDKLYWTAVKASC